MGFTDSIVIHAKVSMWKFAARIRNFFEEEHGVANVVATVILVLIVVLIIAVFWEQLSEWLKNMMEIIFNPGNIPQRNQLE